ncbi:hypothetical protein BH09ACT4_BH09ACT4_06930 [soil metagenome]
MILIWQRWGILAILFVPIGIAIGFLLKAILGVPNSPGNAVGALVGVGLIISAALMWLVVRATVGKIIDKPKPAFVWQHLAEPVVDANGATQTQRAIAVTDPDTGQQLWTHPRSTLFFIPLKYLPFVLADIGVLAVLANLAALALGFGSAAAATG